MQIFPDAIAFGSVVLATFVLWGAVSVPRLLGIAQIVTAFAAVFFALTSFYFFTHNSTFWTCVITSTALSNITLVIRHIRQPHIPNSAQDAGQRSSTFGR